MDPYDLSEVGIFDGYGEYDISDIPEMRPGTDPEFEQLQEWYREPDLRDNTERAFIGIADWQADFPAVAEPTETTEQAVERLLSYFV